MKSKLEIYGLSVCFAAVVCLVISMGIAGYSAFQVAVPELTMPSYQYNRLKTNDTYWNSKRSCSKDETPEAKPTDEELTKQRLEALAADVSEEKRDGFQSLIRCFMFVFVASITLLIHWRIAKSARGA